VSLLDRLRTGDVVRTVRPFRDYDGREHPTLRRLTFQSVQFLPYHGGYTLTFTEDVIRLQEDEQVEILDRFEEYFELVPAP